MEETLPMRRFINDIKRYWPYISYSAVCDLRSEVASSYINWLWWILDPICFMLVYVFVGTVVFRNREPYFPIFVFLGLTLWYFFSKNTSASTTLVRSYKSIVSKVYIPRYMLVLQKMITNFVKMCISITLIILMLLIYRVPFSIKIIYIFPIMMVVIIVTFGISTILLHLGVFMDDLSNIINVLLRLVMYLSGIFYSLDTRVPEPYNKLLLYGNPLAFCIDATRKSILYQNTPNIKVLIIWFIFGLSLSGVGVSLVYRYESIYAKVI